ncbi:MAG TPA: hypothetical protein V6D30_05465 [Leptolyngbyaceae cyanobacterium]
MAEVGQSDVCIGDEICDRSFEMRSVIVLPQHRVGLANDYSGKTN